MAMRPDALLIARQVALALQEDLGEGDLTAGLIDADADSRVEILCRESAVLCGSDWFDEAFRQLDPAVSIEWLARDGDRLQPDQTICKLSLIHI